MPTISFDKIILFGMGNGPCLQICAPLTVSELFVVKNLIADTKKRSNSAWSAWAKSFFCCGTLSINSTMTTTCCSSQYALPENILINWIIFNLHKTHCSRPRSLLLHLTPPYKHQPPTRQQLTSQPRSAALIEIRFLIDFNYGLTLTYLLQTKNFNRK